MTQTTSAPAGVFPCPRCRTWLQNGTLACPACGGLVYSHQLHTLSSEAQRQEPTNPIAAAQLWQQALPLLPPNSQQYELVRGRIGMLLSRMGMPVTREMTTPVSYSTPAPKGPDTWRVAVAKTAGSMLISILVYAMLFRGNLLGGLIFSTGFVLLILVHELGHVIAMRYYGLRASPPIFIPFLGAVIRLRDQPKDAFQEAVVGIGGPVLGTLAAIVCFVWYQRTGSQMLLALSYFGFLLNLFNLLPVPPLDGGRVTAAVSPWIWLPGLCFVPGWIVYDWVSKGYFNFILVLLLMFAWPRVKLTLFSDARNAPYYDIGRKRMWLMGAAYLALGVTLIVLFLQAKSLAPPML